MVTLSDSDTFKFWHFPIPTLSNSDTFQLWHFLILTLSNYDTFKFWHFPILTPFDSDTFWFWHFPIPTLSNVEEKCILTLSSLSYQDIWNVPQIVPFISPVWCISSAALCASRRLRQTFCMPRPGRSAEWSGPPRNRRDGSSDTYERHNRESMNIWMFTMFYNTPTRPTLSQFGIFNDVSELRKISRSPDCEVQKIGKRPVG